jgi:hypothetical protein
MLESNGTKIPVTVNLVDTILDAKQKYSEKKQHQVDKIELKYNDRTLDDQDTVAKAFVGQAGGSVTVAVVLHP